MVGFLLACFSNKHEVAPACDGNSWHMAATAWCIMSLKGSARTFDPKSGTTNTAPRRHPLSVGAGGTTWQMSVSDWLALEGIQQL